jgi:hypothetical protein
MSLPELNLTLGSSRTFVVQCWQDSARTVPCAFNATDALAANVYLQQGQPPYLQGITAWYTAGGQQTGYQQGQPQVTFTTGLSSQLQAGVYSIIFWMTPQGSTESYAVWEGTLKVSPGAPSPPSDVPPDLITGSYCVQLLSQLGPTDAQLESIPPLIVAASNAIRSWCNRRFDQGIVVETLQAEYDGMIRLARPPINFIKRIQDQPQQALSISNGTANIAYVYPAATGDIATGQTIYGMTLESVTNGVLTSQIIPYLGNPTIAALATTINSYANGWTASPDPTYGAWPVAELGFSASKGAGPNDQPWGAALFYVLVDSETTPRFDPEYGQRTGMVWVGRARNGGVATRWGPGGEELFGVWGYQPGIVKVTYNGGFATVPQEVQLACAELVKAQLERLRAPLILKSEAAGEYRYEINDRMVMALPPHVLQGLSRWRLTNA